jgi:quinol-cytochrome oxidoreductase complex cytochrome b subunit
MGVVNNFYFQSSDDEPEVETEISESNSESFPYFLFKFFKVCIFILGVYYILTFFPQFNQYKNSIKPVKVSSKLVQSNLESQNKEINAEREAFFNGPKQRRVSK